MIQSFKEHIDDNLPFLKESRLLVACSGGLDSVSLAHLLIDLNCEIALAHCNFSLRGAESEADESFVVELAESLSIPVFTETFDTKAYADDQKLSVQMAARELRYKWFAEILESFKYEYLLTAHHANDNLETFLINLSRGSGLRGLTGIPQQNEKIIRPLLPFTRDTILEYAKTNKIYWREDSSNASADYLRNKIRHDVVPALEEVSENFQESVITTQKNLKASQDLVDDYLTLVYNLVVTETADGYAIATQKLKELPNTEALLFGLLQSFGFTAWKDIIKLLDAQSGKQIFSDTHRLLKDRDRLLLTGIISEADREITIDEETTGIEHPISLRFSIVEKIGQTNSKTAYLDRQKLSYPLLLRKWQEGDSFQPLGMKGKKKLSKFFKDEKLSLVAKEKMRVLCSKDQIVWIVGMRPDDRFKVTEKTREILKIVYSPH
jgi:tRNA(Ile)-lysidine synthase